MSDKPFADLGQMSRQARIVPEAVIIRLKGYRHFDGD